MPIFCHEFNEWKTVSSYVWPYGRMVMVVRAFEGDDLPREELMELEVAHEP